MMSFSSVPVGRATATLVRLPPTGSAAARNATAPSVGAGRKKSRLSPSAANTRRRRATEAPFRHVMIASTMVPPSSLPRLRPYRPGTRYSNAHAPSDAAKYRENHTKGGATTKQACNFGRNARNRGGSSGRLRRRRRLLLAAEELGERTTEGHETAREL